MHIIDSSLADGDIAQLLKLKINEAEETEFDNVYYAINDSENLDIFSIQMLSMNLRKHCLMSVCCSSEGLLMKKESKTLHSDVWNIILWH